MELSRHFSSPTIPIRGLLGTLIVHKLSVKKNGLSFINLLMQVITENPDYYFNVREFRYVLDGLLEQGVLVMGDNDRYYKS